MSTIAILQARVSSTRLPGKVMALINDFPMIYWQLQRIKKAKKIDKIVVVTSIDSSDDALANYLSSLDVEVRRGSLTDVHSRFLQVILNNREYINVVRLTGDCPLTMPQLLDEMIEEFTDLNLDYYSNGNPPTYPDGLDIEIFTHTAFILLSEMELSEEEREHVTLGFRNKPNSFAIGNKENLINDSNLRWTVDYQEDLEFVRKIFQAFKSREDTFDYEDVKKLIAVNSSVKQTLSGNLRNIALQQEGGEVSE